MIQSVYLRVFRARFDLAMKLSPRPLLLATSINFIVAAYSHPVRRQDAEASSLPTRSRSLVAMALHR